MGKFTTDLETFQRNAIDKCDQVTRMVALEVFRRIIMRTPVDTGRARGNWICTIAVPAEMTEGIAAVNDTDPSGRATIQAMSDEVLGWNPREIAVYLTNNLPYIERLEDGYSQQAPAGMVSVTIAEFDGIAAAVMR